MIVQLGVTVSGIEYDTVLVELPIFVLPEYVVIAKVRETTVPVVFLLANANGGVQLMLVEEDFVTTVPVANPQVYVIVCVKLLLCLVTVSVWAFPSMPFITIRIVCNS